MARATRVSRSGARDSAARQRLPVATYRFQFNKEFTFSQAAALVPYLASLGISDVYASPLLTATPQSTHGYDVCRFDQLNPNLGAQRDFARLGRELKKRRMGLLLDMVPNHMAAHLSNPWWFDVLEKGQASKFAPCFDIDWTPPNPELKGKVLLP